MDTLITLSNLWETVPIAQLIFVAGFVITTWWVGKKLRSNTTVKGNPVDKLYTFRYKGNLYKHQPLEVWNLYSVQASPDHLELVSTCLITDRGLDDG